MNLIGQSVQLIGGPTYGDEEGKTSDLSSDRTG
jgi:hypothetical protein